MGDLSSPASNEMSVDSKISEILGRPAAMVFQSNFVKRLEEQVKQEIDRAGCHPLPFEMTWLYDEIRRETKGGSSDKSETEVPPPSESQFVDEPEEKMVARLKIYKRAFSALILHFEALRPILRDIKRNYDGMLALRERQVAESTKIKKKIHNLELSLDDKLTNVRFEGYKQLAELEKQCFLLIRHVDKQDLAMHRMTDILQKLETALGEEHDLRRDSEDQRKLLIVEINDLRRKYGMTPRPVNESITIKTDEEIHQEETPITTEDPIILRRALEICRENLTTAREEADNPEDHSEINKKNSLEDEDAQL